MENTKSKPFFDLLDNVFTFSKIYCDHCKKEEVMGGDDLDCVEAFYSEGWRKGRTKIYCPVCAKLKLNKNEQKEKRRK